jgi:DNA-binding SARP family transcriptional activator/TolB-like protein
MEGLNLALFGGLRLLRAEGQEINLRSRPNAALLAYLAMNAGQRLPREKLANLLWADVGHDTDARTRLRVSLAALRSALRPGMDEFIVADGETVRFDPSGMTVDVRKFEKLAAQDDRAALEAAAALYVGDLLEGFDFVAQDSTAFTGWLEAERERLRSIAVRSLSRLAKLYLEENEFDPAIRIGRRLLEIDDLNEDSYRLLMEIYALAGRRDQAVQVFNALAETLCRELDIEPGPESRALLEDIKSGRRRRKTNAEPQPLPATKDGSTKGTNVRPLSRQPAAAPLQSGRKWLVPRFLRPVARRVAAMSGRAKIRWALGVGAALPIVVFAVVSAIFWHTPQFAPAFLGDLIRIAKRQLSLEQPTVLIVPFQAVGDGDAAQYAGAMGEGIGTALGIASDLNIVIVTDTGAGPRPARRSLIESSNAEYVLEGRVEKFGGQVSIQPRLVDPWDGNRQVWARRYDGEIENFLDWQREITLAIISELKVNLAEGESARIDRLYGTRNLDAYLAAAEGEKYLRRFNALDNERARDYFEIARALDPGFSVSWEGIAWTYFVEARFGWAPQPAAAMAKVIEFAQKARELNPERSRTLGLFAMIALAQGDHQKAVMIGEQAIALNDGDTDVKAMLAYALTYAGEPERAIGYAQEAIRLRPYPPEWYHWVLAKAYRLDGRTRDALSELSTSRAESTDVSLVELILAQSQAQQIQKARAASARLLRINPNFSIGRFMQLVRYSDARVTDTEIRLLHQAGLPD